MSCLRKQDDGQAADDDLSQHTIRLPANSPCGQSFLHHLEILDPGRHLSPIATAIEVRAVAVNPLVLDTVYITVEKNLLKDIDDAQGRFGGGFNDPQQNGINGRDRARASKVRDAAGKYWNTLGAADDRLSKILRETVAATPVIYAGSTLTLPLPSHPITHISPPPAVVTACEPATQGLISANTRIVIIQANSAAEKNPRRRPPKPAARNMVEDDTDDTSNEQFYSAAEDREDDAESETDGFSEQSDADHSSQPDSDEVSDDSLEDMISLAAPDLPSQRWGALTGTMYATPRPGSGRHTGTQTPGSTYSGFTAATARPSTRAGKVCRAEALLQRIPIAALHPKPNREDDDSCFVFVDINTLTRIGCFSGDWVRIEQCRRPYMNGITSLNLDSIGSSTEEPSDWRIVRIFGLSNLTPRKPRYMMAKELTSKALPSSSSEIPLVYIPPVLLHNLRSPGFVKLSALPKPERSRASISRQPPLAKEVTLRKVSTPLSTRKEVQSSLFASLKQHFQQSFRILKTGDVIAVTLDEELSRATFNVGQNLDIAGEEVASALSAASPSDKAGKLGVAWFYVEQVAPEDTDSSNRHLVAEDPWGGIVVVDSSRIRMAQAGSCVQGISQSLLTNTAIWLGVRKSPPRPSLWAKGLDLGGAHSQPYILPLQKRLSDLVSTAASPRALSLGLPPLAILLHSTQRRIGKSYLATSACAAAGMHAFSISAQDVLADGGSSNGGGDMKTELSFKTRVERGLSCGSPYTSLLITHVEMLTADRMLPTLSEVISDFRVLIATTTELEKIPDGIRSLFSHELEVTAPNEVEREGILHNACLYQSLRLDPSVDLGAIALKTAALVAGDLVDVVHRATLAHEKRLEELAAAKSVSVSDVKYSGGPWVANVVAADFDAAIVSARNNFSDSIGAPKIPTVTWQDVGGLADQKSSIMETISLPLSHPELFAKGMRKRSGILFYGPPGTGKTLLAKAIATEFSLNFFSVKGPELLNMYIGESEANVRRVFQRARDARPCVVFFDELDSVAPKRGNQGDSGGVMDRIVSQLLAELDGMSSGGSGDKDSDGVVDENAGGVFVIGATNRPDLLDPALLRPGRFDKMLYLGVSSTHEQQVTILEALTRKFTLAEDVVLTRVASRLPFTYTGADLYALCSDAMLKAITRKTMQVDVKVREASRARGEDISTAYYFDHLATPDDTTVVVREEDFAAAQRELVASVR